MGFSYKAPLTYNHTQCGSADSSNFPALIYGSDATLKDVAHGGYVNSSTGADVLVFSDSGLTTQLPTEIDYYDNVNGVIWLWVQIPTLSHSTNGTVYLAVGNASPPARTALGWAALGYGGVWHLASLTYDSTGQNTTTNLGAASTTGQIDGAANVNGSSTYIDVGQSSAVMPSGKFSLSCWVNRQGNGTSVPGLISSPVQSNNGTGYVLLTSVAGANIPSLYVDQNGLGVSYAHADAVSALPLNTWTYVAGVFDGTKLQVYINGAASGSSASSVAAHYGSPIYPGTIGKYGRPANAQYFQGYMDEIRATNFNYSDSWITSEYNNQSSPGNIGSPGFWTWGSWVPIMNGGPAPMTLTGVGA